MTHTIRLREFKLEVQLWIPCQKLRRKGYGSHERRGTILSQVSIDQHSAIVDTLRRFLIGKLT